MTRTSETASRNDTSTVAYKAVTVFSEKLRTKVSGQSGIPEIDLMIVTNCPEGETSKKRSVSLFWKKQPDHALCTIEFPVPQGQENPLKDFIPLQITCRKRIGSYKEKPTKATSKKNTATTTKKAAKKEPAAGKKKAATGKKATKTTKSK